MTGDDYSFSGLSPEAQEAHRELGRAIEKLHRLAHPDEPVDMLMDYFIVAAFTRYDDDGEQTTGYPIYMGPSDVPEYRTRGLIEMGLRELDELFSEDE